MEKIQQSFNALRAWCEIEHFKGWDPYDGLNSRLFQLTPFNKFKWPRIIWMQAFKHSPINLRRITFVPKEKNPAGLGVFLAGYCKLYSSSFDNSEAVLSKIISLSDELIELQTQGWAGSCWGYNFAWQARAFYLPKYYPNVVATSHIANALIDAYEITRDEKYLLTAESACNFILKDLNRTSDKEGKYIFSYSPKDNAGVYNASLLASRLLARVGEIKNNSELKLHAKKSVDFCIAAQMENGSWTYGQLEFHQWIDSFHTGYNLEALAFYKQYSGDETVSESIDRGMRFYLENFFQSDGFAAYYSHQKYPQDLNPVSQLILTLSSSKLLVERKNLAKKVLAFAIDTMQSKLGYFHFQDKGKYKIRIPYMRWTQAWMFYSMAVYLSEIKREV